MAEPAPAIYDLPRHLLGLSKAALEDMCVSCGICCYASVPFGKGAVFVPDLHCKFLSFDESGVSKCEVYGARHDVAKAWCLPLAEAVQKGVFPTQCPYVADMDDYVGSAPLSPEAFALIEPQVRKSILESGKPLWLSDADWKAFV